MTASFSRAARHAARHAARRAAIHAARAFARHLAAAALCLTGVTSANAHHSFNMFDSAKVVTLHGTVQEVQWSNPHVILVVHLDPGPGAQSGAQSAAAPAAQPAIWTVECTSPGNLKRIGWTRKSIKAGDRVDVEINPLRDGSAGGAFQKATLLDSGQVFTAELRDAEKAEDPN